MDLKEDTWKTCTLSLQKEAEQTKEDLQRLQNLHQTWKRHFQTRGLDEFEDIADLAGDTMEELEEPRQIRAVIGTFWNRSVNGYKTSLQRRMSEHTGERWRRAITFTEVTDSTENNVYHFSLSMHFPFPCCNLTMMSHCGAHSHKSSALVTCLLVELSRGSTNDPSSERAAEEAEVDESGQPEAESEEIHRC